MLLLLSCHPDPALKDSPALTSDSHDSPADSHDSPADSRDSPADSPDSRDSPDSPPDSPADTGDTAPALWRSQLYPSDWTPEFTLSDGHFLHDFSYAGYHRSEIDLPLTAPGTVFDAATYGADATGQADSTAGIQAAIDAAAGAGGGVVHIPAGTYRLDGRLYVRSSGIVLQGAGASLTMLYFTQVEGMDYAGHITFSGSVAQGPDILLAEDGAARSHTIRVADTASLIAGTEVAVGQVITEDFVAEHGMTGTWVEFNGQWRSFFRRTVTAVDTSTDPATVTLDVPLRYPMKARDGASLRVESGYLTECGVEDLSLANATDYNTAWLHSQVNALVFSGVSDCWVRRVASWEPPTSSPSGYHLQSNGVLITDSKRVTVADSALSFAQNRGGGGNGYLYEIRRSSEILTRDSTAEAGRHNFIQNWDFGTSGCVWLRTVSSAGRSMLADWDPIGYASYSEFHHSLAMANLIDQSLAADGWQGVNRQNESSGAGHSVTQSVFWNTGGGGYLRSLQYGDGYIIGTLGMDIHTDPTEPDFLNGGAGTAPEDWLEGEEEGATLEPASLFEDQLQRRGF